MVNENHVTTPRSYRQRTFDTVAVHLVTQGQRSITKLTAFREPKCMYRMQGDTSVLKCAIGVLIPDDIYSPEMEDQTITMLMRGHADISRSAYAHLAVLFPFHQLPFLQSLQEFHDMDCHWSDKETLITALCDLAKDWKLNHNCLLPYMIPQDQTSIERLS